MNIHSTEQQIDFQAWHFAYRQASGQDVCLNFYRESMWREFLRYMKLNRPDFCEADLRAVIALRKSRKQHNAKGHHSVAFSSIVGSPDIIEEEISESRARSREHKRTPRQSILRAVGRPEQPKEQCKPVKDVLAEAKAFAAFREQMVKEGLL